MSVKYVNAGSDSCRCVGMQLVKVASALVRRRKSHQPQMLGTSPGRLRLLASLLGLYATCAGANAALTVIGVQYQQDQMFPEFDCYWNGGGYPTFCPTNYPGVNLHVYVKNTGASSATITDATLTSADYSLAAVIEMNAAVANLSSIYYY